MKKELERTTKPFKSKKCYVSLYKIQKDDLYCYWIVEICNNNGKVTYSNEIEDYTYALYEFYFNLCWLLNRKVMRETFLKE